MALQDGSPPESAPIRRASAMRQRGRLLYLLVLSDLQTRYRGSVLGVAWALLTPLLMLGVYTFVFGQILPMRWPQHTGESASFLGAVLFCGLTLFGFFSDVISRAPMVVVHHRNYVQKLVFPLQLLPLVLVCTALLHMAIAIGLLALFIGLVLGLASWTFLAIPVVMLPVIVWAAGFAWLLASIGVYVRDLAQVVGLGVTALMFVSPIFYPASVIPERWRVLFDLNPLAIPIEQMRAICLSGNWPDWRLLGANLLGAVAVAVCGYWIFGRVKAGFADVL